MVGKSQKSRTSIKFAMSFGESDAMYSLGHLSNLSLQRFQLPQP